MTCSSIAAFAGMLAFTLTMVYSGVTDLTTFKIHNRPIVLSLAAYAVVAPLAGRGTCDIGLNLTAAAIVLAVGFCLFSFGWIGGGDAKLASVTVLWCGADQTFAYAAYAALLGGVLSVLIALLRLQPAPAWFDRLGWVARLRDPRGGMPYGVAMAVAGLLIFRNTSWVSEALGLSTP
jgi:prepilin peptidase CpaA